MIIDNFNLNLLRIFESVYRTKSMTLAARELHLTQSGVSQHMKALEESLEVPLFDRINQRLVPTVQAKELYQLCKRGLNVLEQALWKMKKGEKELSGVVSIGMPVEFGTNVIMAHLAKFGLSHEAVQIKVRLDFASAMNEMLLRGDLDFAFVDEYRMDKRIKTESVFSETVELCVAQELLKKAGPPRNNRKYYEKLPYIAYQEDEPILRNWFQHHVGNRNLKLNVRAFVMDVQGIMKLVQNGLGAAAVPDYLLAKLPPSKRDRFKIHRFKGCGKPMRNDISLAYLREKTHSGAAVAVMDALRKSLTGAPECG